VEEPTASAGVVLLAVLVFLTLESVTIRASVNSTKSAIPQLTIASVVWETQIAQAAIKFAT
jgi:hypothetical protein